MESAILDRLQNALTLLQQGSLEEADIICRQVLTLRPREFHALHLAGLVALQQREHAGAERWLRAALAVDPAQAPAHSNLAAVLLAQRRPLEALEHSDRAISLAANFAQAWTNRAAALAELGRTQESEMSYERALTLAPSLLDANLGLGNLLLKGQRYAAALESFDRALAIAPAHADALNNRGIALRRLQRPAEAIDSYRRALRLAPDSPDVLSNLGNVFLGLEEFDEAVRCCDRALALQPDLPDALNIRATALRDSGRFEDAADAYSRLVRSAPDFDYARGNRLFARAFCCDWSERSGDAARLIDAVRAGRRACLPFSFLSVSDSAAAQLQCARTLVEDRCAQRTALPPRRAQAHERIRLAYVSGDFADHAVAFLLAGLFERHDRSRFETFAISLRPEQPTPFAQRVTCAFEHFIDVSRRSDADIDGLMADLEIDIAVDLVGFTSGMRPEIFARRMAPIQVNYLGFPGTFGADFMDYLIADEFVVPPALRAQYSEKIVSLPDSFQCFDDRRATPAHTPARAAVGLPDGALVLCSFNNSYKINPALFDTWMRLLAQVPAAVLWLQGARESVRRNLRHEAQRRGIAPERMVFAGRCPYPEHLARLPLADLFLDCLPFNAGATASDALSMGVPVLTATGEAFAARMAGSLLTVLDMPELIARDLDDYESRALALARRPDELRWFKQRLTTARHSAPLFDTDRFRRHLEMAYERMWERWRQGQEPESFRVPPLPA